MFNQKEYKAHKRDVEIKLKNKIKTTYDYMQIFQTAIMMEEYEYAKAIDECLASRGVDVKETHPYIETLK
jgi:predicted nuclease with RNAse H fold